MVFGENTPFVYPSTIELFFLGLIVIRSTMCGVWLKGECTRLIYFLNPIGVMCQEV